MEIEATSKGFEAEELEGGAWVGRADDSQPEGVGRHGIGAEAFAAVELGHAGGSGLSWKIRA